MYNQQSQRLPTSNREDFRNSGYNNNDINGRRVIKGFDDLSRKRRYESPDDSSPLKRFRSSYDSATINQSNRFSLSPEVIGISSNGTNGHDTLQVKLRRLEAWKRKVSQGNLLQKLDEEKRRRREQSEHEKVQISSIHSPENTVNGSSTNSDIMFTGKSSKNHFDEEKAEVKQTINDDDDDDDVDTLDAYMNEINKQVKPTSEGGPAQMIRNSREEDLSHQTITLEEIMNHKSTNDSQTLGNTQSDSMNDDNGGIDEETFHKQFMDALRKKEDEERRKKEEAYEKWKNEQSNAENGTVSSTREIYFSDDEVEDAAAVDQYFTSHVDISLLPSSNSAGKNKKDLKPVDHSKMNYAPFRKDFYIVPRELRDLTPEDIHNIRKEMSNIRVRGHGCPPPVRNWVQCGLDDATLNLIEDLGYGLPFPIQAQAIPCIMSGKNVIGIAKTGSGKTLAYILPMIRHILDQPPLREGDGPIGLIISPTRELTTQIYAELTKFTKLHGLKAVCAYGGTSIAEQIAALKRGAHIIVCTPGRMIDLLCANKGRVTNLSRVTYVVLDEADRMFDMGFGPQITRIVNNVRPNRQVVLFSATFPKPLEALAQQTLKDSIEIIVGGRSIVAENIRQYVEIRDEGSKFLRLLELLGIWNDKGNILIFVDKQTEVGNLFKDLMSAGYDVLCMHGGMDQMDRDYTIQQFKKKEKTIMLATSVAARGLHVDDLVLVVNYTVPNHYEDYVHRVGRTGRAGKSGTAYTFVTPDEERYTPDLVKALRQSNNEVSPELDKMAKEFLAKKKSGLVGKQYPKKLSGFTGSGFKFDLSERNKKKEEMKRQMKTLGVDDAAAELLSDDEEEKEEDIDATIKLVKKGPQERESTSVPNLPNLKITSNMSAIEKAKAFASALNIATSLEAVNSLAPKPTVAASIPPSTSATQTQDHYETEIEINDYPQQARWEVTHKDALYEVHDYTGAQVTTKGIYVEQNEVVPPGERKLYLLVEGPTHESVRRARMFIKRRLDQASLRETETRHSTRFSIF